MAEMVQPLLDAWQRLSEKTGRGRQAALLGDVR